MTYLQLINKVLQRLRIDQVSTLIGNDYASLIGEFVNEAKREVEDAWNWTSLRTSLTVITEPDVYSYKMDGAGHRVRLIYDEHRRPNAWNITDKVRMNGPMKGEYMTKALIFDKSRTSPRYFDINGEADNVPLLNIYPIPDGIYELQFDVVAPQEDLVNESDELLVPHWPVILGAYATAISERGEDGGLTYDEVMNKYHYALADAIQLDRANLYDELVAEVI